VVKGWRRWTYAVSRGWERAGAAEEVAARAATRPKMRAEYIVRVWMWMLERKRETRC
jgi:hypothetical protein